ARRPHRHLAGRRAGGRLPRPAPARRRQPDDRSLRAVVPHRFEPERPGAKMVRQRRGREIVHRADRAMTLPRAVHRKSEAKSPGCGVSVTRDRGDTGPVRTILRAQKMLGLRGEAGAVAAVGKYRIVLPLGQGGTADVYLAVAEGPSGFTKLVVVKV